MSINEIWTTASQHPATSGHYAVLMGDGVRLDRTPKIHYYDLGRGRWLIPGWQGGHPDDVAGLATVQWWVALPAAPAERNIWDDGRVECGDVMRRHADGSPSRRLCGGCSRLVDVTDDEGRIQGSELARPEGCGEVLERRPDEPPEPPPGISVMELGGEEVWIGTGPGVK